MPCCHSDKAKKYSVSFLVRTHVTQYLPCQAFFPLLAGVIIFVVRVFRPQDIATVAAADSVLSILF